jgi:hypothetical protein
VRNRNVQALGNPPHRQPTGPATVLCGLLACAVFLALPSCAAAQGAMQAQPQSTGSQTSTPGPLPSAPQPQSQSTTGPKAAGPCPIATKSTTAAQAPATTTPQPCPAAKPAVINWFARFLNGPQVKPLTPKEKAQLAVRNVLDPFNAITILGQSGIAVASDPDSPYGPGMPGFARNVGVSYTQDITGEFFGTFLIPSIVHQDPHYHRMPHASIPHRIGHAILQVVWTQGDNGRGMLNYSNLLGGAIEAEISNLYVPGIQSNAPSTASRYAIGLATAPIDNFITEFLPDVASHIHVRVVLVQRVINQVARSEGGGS